MDLEEMEETLGDEESEFISTLESIDMATAAAATTAPSTTTPMTTAGSGEEGAELRPTTTTTTTPMTTAGRGEEGAELRPAEPAPPAAP